MKASPAPVVSTTRTRGAGRRRFTPAAIHRLPRRPSLTIVRDICDSRRSPILESGFELVHEHHIDGFDELSKSPPPRQRRSPPEVPRRRCASRPKPRRDARPHTAAVRRKGEVHVRRASAHDCRREPRLQPRIDAGESGEGAIVPRRQRNGDRVRLAAVAHVGGADAFATQESFGDPAEPEIVATRNPYARRRQR